VQRKKKAALLEMELEMAGATGAGRNPGSQTLYSKL